MARKHRTAAGKLIRNAAGLLKCSCCGCAADLTVGSPSSISVTFTTEVGSGCFTTVTNSIPGIRVRSSASAVTPGALGTFSLSRTVNTINSVLYQGTATSLFNIYPNGDTTCSGTPTGDGVELIVDFRRTGTLCYVICYFRFVVFTLPSFDSATYDLFNNILSAAGTSSNTTFSGLPWSKTFESNNEEFAYSASSTFYGDIYNMLTVSGKVTITT